MMLKFWKWWNQHRPIVLYRFWFVLMLLNLANALFFAWVSRTYPEMEVRKTMWWCVVMGVLCFAMTQLWRYYLNNPDKYEKLRKRRLGRPRRGTKIQDEKKKTRKD